MIKSMTAYARAENQIAPYTVRVEMRTYNSRHLDIALKLSHGFESLEDRIRGVVCQTVARGRVDIRVQIQDDADAGSAFAVNLPRARAYHDALVSLNQALGLSDPVRIDTILSAGNLIQAVDVEKNIDTVWPQLETCLQNALTGLDDMRRAEGDHLARDFRQRLNLIESMLDQIRSESAQVPAMVRQRLEERIDALTHGVVEIDPGRIAQEAALLADRSDISEEVVRVASHIQQFRHLMDDGSPAGRPLNFLLQEFNREFNTMGSKAGKANMAHVIVAAKSELEKIREQVQNVE